MKRVLSTVLLLTFICLALCGCSKSPEEVKSDLVGCVWSCRMPGAEQYLGGEIVAEFVFYDDGTVDYTWIENGVRKEKYNPTYEILEDEIVVSYGYDDDSTITIEYYYKDGKLSLDCEDGGYMSRN